MQELRKPDTERLGRQPLSPSHIGLDIYFPFPVHIYVHGSRLQVKGKKQKQKSVFNVSQFYAKLLGYFFPLIGFSHHICEIVLSFAMICMR